MESGWSSNLFNMPWQRHFGPLLLWNFGRLVLGCADPDLCTERPKHRRVTENASTSEKPGPWPSNEEFEKIKRSKYEVNTIFLVNTNVETYNCEDVRKYQKIKDTKHKKLGQNCTSNCSANFGESSNLIHLGKCWPTCVKMWAKTFSIFGKLSRGELFRYCFLSSLLGMRFLILASNTQKTVCSGAKVCKSKSQKHAAKSYL